MSEREMTAAIAELRAEVDALKSHQSEHCSECLKAAARAASIERARQEQEQRSQREAQGERQRKEAHEARLKSIALAMQSPRVRLTLADGVGGHAGASNTLRN